MTRLCEFITERDTLQSLCEALEDHAIAPDKIVSVFRVEPQSARGRGRPPRFRVLYRGAA